MALRRAKGSDLPFLQNLHASFRAMELAPLPWSDAQKRAFLDDQFRLQHLHFLRFYAKADFWIVQGASSKGVSAAIGRLYLDRSTAPWRIVDIGFLPSARRRGMGSALIHWIQRSAASAGACGVALSVAANNQRAQALYLRAGFVTDGPPEGFHQAMLWREDPS